MNKFYSIFLIAIFFIATDSFARENVPNGSGKGNTDNSTLATGCSATTAKTDLDINNVRTTILVGSDMWWDVSNPKHEVPKGSGKHSMFAGALWIGGLDAGNQLKMAAMTYRQDGNDFWGGPINQSTVDVTPTTCSKYDRHWKITRQEVADFKTNFVDNGNSPVAGYVVPEAIRTWPGNGDSIGNNETSLLAPFFDSDGDREYDYTKGDYPLYDFGDTLSCTACGNPDYQDILFGHQTLWWVFNDVGNIHLETEAPAIGLEVQAQAFAFNSNNEINSMTFYKYKIINRGTTTLFDTYFGQWVDPDLGNYIDDYVGCDVGRGLGYC
ncbi:MAG: T9SS type A sorting domain-containing protein, partial [Bacteroidia bacterium]